MKKDESYKLAYKTLQKIIARLGNNLFSLKAIGIPACFTLIILSANSLYIDKNATLSIIFSTSSLFLSFMFLYIHSILLASERNFREYGKYITKKYDTLNGMEMLLLNIGVLKNIEGYKWTDKWDIIMAKTTNLIWILIMAISLGIFLSSFFV